MMSYPACVWRLGVLGAKDVRTPADWGPCREASGCGKCVAQTMRQEELLKGRAIYFKDRNIVSTPKRKWGDPYLKPVSAAKPVSSAKSVAPGSIADAMVKVDSGYGAAVTAAVRKETSPVEPSKPTPAPPVTPVAPVAPVAQAKVADAVAALPSESPLQLAMRLAAQRKAASTQPTTVK